MVNKSSPLREQDFERIKKKLFELNSILRTTNQISIIIDEKYYATNIVLRKLVDEGLYEKESTEKITLWRKKDE